jgi:hypothetical protein
MGVSPEEAAASLVENGSTRAHIEAKALPVDLSECSSPRPQRL